MITLIQVENMVLNPDRMFRICCFENNKQSSSSHLELVISESGQFFAYYLSKYTAKNWLFSKITRPRWQDEKNRLLFSVTGMDHQGQIVYNFCWESQWNNIITLSQKVFVTFKLAFSMLQYWNFQNIGFFRSSPKAQFGPEKKMLGKIEMFEDFGTPCKNTEKSSWS